MNAERRISGHFVEFLFDRARGTSLADSFKKAGLNLDAVEADYPAERLANWLDLYADTVLPQRPRGEAHRQLGFELIARKRAKYEGASLHEAIGSLPEKFNRMGNFFDFEVHEGPRGLVATMDDVACLHTFFLGMLEAVTSSTAPDVKVVWRPDGLSGARYEVHAPQMVQSLSA